MNPIFISSAISGMEAMRQSTEDACEVFDLDVIKAENFVARSSSPRIACLDGVAKSGCVILLIGERYGHIQKSGKSATHEEFEEAVRLRKPVIVFVTSSRFEAKQQEFIDELGDWQDGKFWRTALTPSSLQKEVGKSLRHALDESMTVSENTADSIADGLRRCTPQTRHGGGGFQDPWLTVSWSAGSTTHMDEDRLFNSDINKIIDLTVSGETRLLDNRPSAQSIGNDGILLSANSGQFAQLDLLLWIGLTGNVSVGGTVSIPQKSFLSNYFAPPSNIKSDLTKKLDLIAAVHSALDAEHRVSAGLLQISMSSMENRFVKEDPGLNSGNIPMFTSEPDPMHLPQRPESTPPLRLRDSDALSKLFTDRIVRAYGERSR